MVTKRTLISSRAQNRDCIAYCPIHIHNMAEIIICSFDVCRFSTAEMKRLYRIFKSECPSGLITEEVFHNIFSKFFPLGAESYSGKQY